jgi:O-antigen ligase
VRAFSLNGIKTNHTAVRAGVSRQRSLEAGPRDSTNTRAYEGVFWTIAALACAVAIASVPVFSAREGLSAIPQYAALAVVILAGFSLFLRIPRIHPGVICYAALVAMWALTYERAEEDAYFTFVKLAVFALAVHLLIRTPKHLLLLLGGYSIAAMIGLLINWGEIRELRYAMETVERGVSSIRLEGTFSNANRAGIFAAMALVSSLIVFFNLRHWARWLFLLAGVCGGLVVGGLSGSRTGMLGIMVAGLAVPFMAVAGEHGRLFVKAGKATLLAALAIGIVATTLLQLPQFERFTRLTEGTAADGSTAARWEMAQASIDVWKAHPIAGAGFRGFHKVSEFAGRSAHTAFGAVLADGGVIGFALFCTWYFCRDCISLDWPAAARIVPSVGWRWDCWYSWLCSS